MMRLDFLLCGITANKMVSEGDIPDYIQGGTEFIYDLIKSLKLPLRTQIQRKALYPDKYDYNYEFVGRQDLGFFTCHHIWKWTPLQIDETIGGLLIIKDHKYKDYLSEDKLREFINTIIEEEVDLLITG